MLCYNLPNILKIWHHGPRLDLWSSSLFVVENRKSSSWYYLIVVGTNLTFLFGHHSSLHRRNNNTLQLSNTHTRIRCSSIHPSIHAHLRNTIILVHPQNGWMKPDEIGSSWIVVIDWLTNTYFKIPRWWVWHTSVE
jgi:hypothetical protein